MIWNFIPSKDTIANDDDAHNAVMCARSSQSCDQSTFFSVFYGRDTLTDVKDNNPDDNLTCDDGKYGELKYEKNYYILTHAIQVLVRNVALKQKAKIN